MAIRRKISPKSEAVATHSFVNEKPNHLVQPLQPAQCNILAEVRNEVEKFGQNIQSQITSSYESVKKYLGFMDFIAKPAYDKLVKFYSAASENLVKLEELAIQPGADEELRNTLVAITNYLKKRTILFPGHLVEYWDRQTGLILFMLS